MKIGIISAMINALLCVANFEFWSLFIFRVLTGFSLGLLVSPSLAYINDVTPKEIRGKFIAICSTSFTFG